jgi:hypothetical protein
MKKLTEILTKTLFFIVIISLPGTLCLAADYPQIEMKGIVKYIVSSNTYGIFGEDGKKYQPIRQLPKEYRKDGLEVVIQAYLRRDVIGSRMWGTAVDIVKISKAERYISDAERQAVQLLLQRMEAFNRKDLLLLQQVDTMARSLTRDQFLSWVSGYGNYTLHYVEAAKMDQNTMTGFCLYSRELENGMALSGNIQHALMQFTLMKTEDGWKFEETRSYRPDDRLDLERYFAEFKARSQRKFGTDNLAQWKE